MVARLAVDQFRAGIGPAAEPGRPGADIVAVSNKNMRLLGDLEADQDLACIIFGIIGGADPAGAVQASADAGDGKGAIPELEIARLKVCLD